MRQQLCNPLNEYRRDSCSLYGDEEQKDNVLYNMRYKSLKITKISISHDDTIHEKETFILYDVILVAETSNFKLLTI